MTGLAFPSRAVSVGIVKESAYGAGGTPVLCLPVTSVAPNDLPGLLVDSSWRQAPAAQFGHVVATLDSQLKLGGPVLCDGIGYLLAGVLGDVGFAAGSPNTWTLALLNTGSQQPASYAVTVADPIGALQYAGCKVGQVILTFDPTHLLSWQAALFGVGSASSAAPVPAPSAEKPIEGWRGTVTLGGAVTGYVASAQLSLSRQVATKRNVNGQLAPRLQRSDVLSVVGQFTMVASSDALRVDMQDGTSTSVDFTFTNGLTGAAARKLQLHCSSVVLTQADRAYGARWVELSASFTAEATTGDVGGSGGLSPIKATLQNAVASGTY